MKKLILLFLPKPHPYKTGHFPLSLLALAGPLLQYGYEVKLIDADADEDYLLQIEETARDVICVGISSMTGYQIEGGLQVSRMIKKKYPKIPIVWGGYHPSLLPEQTASNDYVDAVVRGQGEITFTEIVRHLDCGKTLDGILGVTYQRGKEMIVNLDRPFEDINKFPPLPYQLLDFGKYSNPTKPGIRNVTYPASQGCPHRCGFCAVQSVFKGKWFSLTPDRILNDLENLVQKQAVEHISFLDSNFFVSSRRVQAICEGIMARKLKISWNALGRTETVARLDEKLFELLRASGCKMILVGAESGSDRILNLIGKGAIVEDAINCVTKCKENDIRCDSSFMIGLPDETNEDVKETLKLIKRIKSIQKESYVGRIFFYTPYPGTQLYDKALAKGFSEPTRLEDWAKFSVEEITTPWVNPDKKRWLDSAIFSFWHAYSEYPSFKLAKPDDFLLKLGYQFLHFTTLLRVKYLFFHFPWEKIMVDFIKRLWQNSQEDFYAKR